MTLQAGLSAPLSSLLHPLGLDGVAPRTRPLLPPRLVWGAVRLLLGPLGLVTTSQMPQPLSAKVVDGRL